MNAFLEDKWLPTLMRWSLSIWNVFCYIQIRESAQTAKSSEQIWVNFFSRATDMKLYVSAYLSDACPPQKHHIPSFLWPPLQGFLFLHQGEQSHSMPKWGRVKEGWDATWIINNYKTKHSIQLLIPISYFYIFHIFIYIKKPYTQCLYRKSQLIHTNTLVKLFLSVIIRAVR